MKTASRLTFVSAVAFLGASASAQVLNNATFDDGDFQGWYCNGNREVFFGGNPGEYIGVPLMDFWGITLSNDEDPNLLGDLTRYGGPIEVAVDVQVFELNNWWGMPMDPGEFPLVLQLTDTSAFGPDGQISVFFIGDGMPAQGQGWVRYTFIIPDPTSLTLPPGWGGTGSSDPVTYEPMLPADRTYRSVLENVGEIKLTTFVPGYGYIANFWQVGFDNVTVTVLESGGGCAADWDNSGSVNSNDISAFLSAWLESVQQGDLVADFDGSGTVNSNDISAFLNAWLEGVQQGC